MMQTVNESNNSNIRLNIMTAQIIVYVVYTLVSITLTIWVARTLHKNGRVFLIEAFHGSEERADAVNHLLVVGFYLINIGFVLLFLRSGERPQGVIEGIEYCATKLGFVMLVLGAMHFFNMYNFDKMRKKARTNQTPPRLPGAAY
ncbi:hypothetical protein SAMN02745181_2037 [Rubritalea squalenifaciens DSM 18772]|uniref:Uncharacterized protein n=2 Tax=Rubritalea squalenifaciens TaxID=407226 RepID=A0A1M6J883_9BACT|nr:hypothetical protein SAMN02745181_2037 [Rubritalea squalenifaciens DSM 18772]